MAAEDWRFVKVMNLSPRALENYRDRPRYDDLIRTYRNYQYDGLHIAREPTSDPHLCKRCQTIDFKGIFKIEAKSGGNSVFDLGSMRNFDANNCRFCHILVSKADAIKARYPDRDITMWRLELFPGCYIRGNAPEASDSLYNTILGAFPSTFGLRSKALLMDRWIIPIRRRKPSDLDPETDTTKYLGINLNCNAIDYAYLRSRLRTCLIYRWWLKESCQSMSGRIVVIDCATKKLIPLPTGCGYICLSYVWGNNDTFSANECSMLRRTRKLSHDLPKTIQDAINVVMNLKEKYLWIDRYCIDQFHSESKKTHIAMMSEIFGNALVTLVALGSSSTSGLPGVSTVARSPQCRFTAARSEYLYTSPKIEYFLQRSKWSTRGWTYQEASLSKHILYFTPTQAVLLCEEGEAPEEMNVMLPLALRTKNGTNWTDLDQDIMPPFSELPFSSADSGFSFFVSQLRDYRSRDLSYESDSLNAFRGILLNAAYKSWWGVPIYCMRDEEDITMIHALLDETIAKASKGFACGLLWRSCEESIPISSKARRRTMFPTWSWASVKRPISLHSFEIDNREGFSPIHVKSYRLWYDSSRLLFSATIFVSTPGAREPVPLEQFCERHKEKTLPETSQALYIRSYVFRGPWHLHTDAAKPDEKGMMPLRHRLEHPSGMLMTDTSGAPSSSHSHYINFDAESIDECRSIVLGTQNLSAILMLTYPYGQNGYMTTQMHYWLAVTFRQGVARRVGVIRSTVSTLGLGFNFQDLNFGVCKLI